jgi:hypothetical protein
MATLLTHMEPSSTLLHPFFHTKKIGKALDYQCFTGETTKSLYEKFPQLDIYGVDYEKKFVHIASQKYPEFKFGVFPRGDSLEPFFSTKFNVIQVSDYDNFLETFHLMFDLLDENNGLIYFYYHENDKKRVRFWLSNLNKNLMTPNHTSNQMFRILHHDKKKNLFIVSK